MLLFASVATCPLAQETVGRGDFEFFLDEAAFLGADGMTTQEIYIRIPNTQLRFKGQDDRFEAKTRVSVMIRDGEGTAVVEESEEFSMYAATEDETVNPLYFQSLTRRYVLEPGRYQLFCSIQDVFAPKVTLVGMMRGKHKESIVDHFSLNVPDFSSSSLMISEAKFLWNIQYENGVAVHHPNPSRLYGLRCDSLCIYIEVYAPRDLATTGGLEIESIVLDESGETVVERTLKLRAVDQEESVDDEGHAEHLYLYPVVIKEDVNRLPAGVYSLYVNARNDDQLLFRLRQGSFSIAWDIRTWETSRSTFIAEARFLLEDEGDFDEFLKKSIGEQEMILAKMWKELDPDPNTGVNEAYEDFLERLGFVNTHYSDYVLGAFTDRGLIYLKYGRPDELIVDVIPPNRESISDALEKVRDRYHPVVFSVTGARAGYAQPSQDISVDPRRIGAVGEGGEVGYAYELWIYNGIGKPILERDQSLEHDLGLRFIFVDSDGYGRYKLESSSSMSNK